MSVESGTYYLVNSAQGRCPRFINNTVNLAADLVFYSAKANQQWIIRRTENKTYTIRNSAYPDADPAYAVVAKDSSGEKVVLGKSPYYWHLDKASAGIYRISTSSHDLAWGARTDEMVYLTQGDVTNQDGNQLWEINEVLAQ